MKTIVKIALALMGILLIAGIGSATVAYPISEHVMGVNFSFNVPSPMTVKSYVNAGEDRNYGTPDINVTLKLTDGLPEDNIVVSASVFAKPFTLTERDLTEALDLSDADFSPDTVAGHAGYIDASAPDSMGNREYGAMFQATPNVIVYVFAESKGRMNTVVNSINVTAKVGAS